MVDKMQCYYHFDTDSTGRAEYDISGEEYQKLLEICFSYSNTFSVLVELKEPKVASSLTFIENHRIPVTDDVRCVYSHYGNFIGDICNGYEIRHYSLSEDVKKTIIAITDSIYKWISGWGYANPSDPAFYRKDGSVFFSSVIHEGLCMLYSADGENVDEVIRGAMWHRE